MTHPLHPHRVSGTSASTIDGSFVIFTSTILSRVDRVFLLHFITTIFLHVFTSNQRVFEIALYPVLPPFLFQHPSFQLCHRPVSFPIITWRPRLELSHHTQAPVHTFNFKLAPLIPRRQHLYLTRPSESYVFNTAHASFTNILPRGGTLMHMSTNVQCSGIPYLTYSRAYCKTILRTPTSRMLRTPKCIS